MILVALGTQKFQFNRLLKEIETLIINGTIKEEVMIQNGYSDYQSNHFKCIPFFGMEDFEKQLENCSLLITHGGTGTIIGAIKKNKKVIAVARLKQFGEHVDDHQVELIKMFSDSKLIRGVFKIEDLKHTLSEIGSFQPQQFESGNQKIISIIEDFMKKNF